MRATTQANCSPEEVSRRRGTIGIRGCNCLDTRSRLHSARCNSSTFLCGAAWRHWMDRWMDGWPCVVVVFSFTTYFYPGTTTTSVSDHTQENLLFSLSLTQFSSGRTRRVIKLAPIELFPVIAVHLRKCK